jgi:hypothetical protein
MAGGTGSRTNNMKRYVEVFWTPYFFEEDRGVFSVLQQPPKPLFPVLQAQRPNASYLKCPALSESCKNDYVVYCPIDLVVTVDKQAQTVTTDRYSQDFFDRNVKNRMAESNPENPALITLPTRFLFYSNDSVEFEVMDLPILTSKSSENFKIVRGGFNIGKWIRPTELAVEVINSAKPITLCADDPLFLIRFRTANNVPVKLTRVDLTPDLRNVMKGCVNLKGYRPMLKLNKLYKLAENYLEWFKRGK